MSLKQVLAMKKTIHCTRRSWLHFCHDGRIAIVNQKKGEPMLGQVHLTRAEFEQFKRFYERATYSKNGLAG